MSDANPTITSFRELKLPAPLLQALDDVGYETPTPIQLEAMPSLLKGQDLLGHAPTGTGKTAAFAIPLLSRLDIKRAQVQIMVLTPTRELAIQVAEAFQRYAKHIQGFHVLPIYGGQDYSIQTRPLARGVHAVVGTPGRVMDHMRRGTLKLDNLQALVLDEADEMLRMGFIDDVEWILEQAPKERQMALFSATMPREIERIASQYLREPKVISIKAQTTTEALIRQRYWPVSNFHKLDALTRILEVEPFDGLLMFVRTRIATTELAEKLEARGYAAAALNGEMPQKQREQTVNRFKKGSLDILVATDVAARGLDVDRISHVVNYDIPYDIEAYIHRIGRTGRAGRQGDAILFVAPREQRMLYAIETATRQKIERLELPTTEMVNNKRIADFKQGISDIVAAGDLEFMRKLLEQYQHEHKISPLDIAAALAKISIGDKPWLLTADQDRAVRRHEDAGTGPGKERRGPRPGPEKGKGKGKGRPASSMVRYRIDVGHEHGVKPGNIVGAIANEAELDAQHIGNIDIQSNFSIVDLPGNMPPEVFEKLKNTRVCGHRMNISLAEFTGPGKFEKRQPDRKGPGFKKPGFSKSGAGKPAFGKPRSDKPRSDKTRPDKPNAEMPRSEKPRSDKPRSDKPRSDKPRSDKARTGKPAFGKPGFAHPGAKKTSSKKASSKKRTDKNKGAPKHKKKRDKEG